MTQRPDILRLSLGVDAVRRKASLEALAEKTDAIGRNLRPSISELTVRIAEAADYDLVRTAALMNEIFIVAAESQVLAAEALAAAAVRAEPANDG